jgi:glutamate carboxypeptidase
MNSLLLAGLSAIACAAMTQAAGQRGALSSDEQAIVGHVDARTDAALALLERVVNINSGTTNLDGVREVGRMFRTELDRLGFETRWIDQSAVGRAGHLIAERRGPGPKILLIGHLDTVFEPASPFQKFQRVDATTARGPGIIDMKGGDVVMLYALEALEHAGLLKTMHVVVALMGDEEEPGRPRAAAREALLAAAKGAAVALGFEDGDGDLNHAITARRGTASWTLRVVGKAGHSSQIFSPEIGDGAVFELARILNAFRERLAGEAHLSINPGLVAGGTTAEIDSVHDAASAAGKTNVVAADARATGDLRALTAGQFTAAKQAMAQIAAASLPNTSATLTFDEGYPPLAPTDGNARLLALYDRASRDLGFQPVTAVSPDRAGAADVSFVAVEVPMILDAIGLKGHDDHSPNETADLTTLPIQTKRAAVLLARLAKGAGQ